MSGLGNTKIPEVTIKSILLIVTSGNNFVGYTLHANKAPHKEKIRQEFNTGFSGSLIILSN